VTLLFPSLLFSATLSVFCFLEDSKDQINKLQLVCQLRRQVGTLRFDLNNLVEAKGADPASAKSFYKTLESLDFSIRQKDQDTATSLLDEVQTQANALLKSLA